MRGTLVSLQKERRSYQGQRQQLSFVQEEGGRKGGSFSFLSENKNWSFFVVFPEKRIKNLVYSWKLVLEKGSHLLIPQNYLLASVENPWKGFVYLFAFEEQHWL